MKLFLQRNIGWTTSKDLTDDPEYAHAVQFQKGKIGKSFPSNQGY